MSEIVTQTFGINCAMTMVFGGTVIDTNPSSGYDSTEMEAIRKPCDKTPATSLNFYPEAIDVERQSGTPDEDNLSLAATWINGFIPYSRGLPDPENMTRSCETYLKTQNIVTTDQCILSRPEGWLEGLFWHFKWFNSQDTSDKDRLVEEEFVRENILTKLIMNGLVCRKWQYQPPSIRYMVREKAINDEVPDYVYLIGGSSDMVRDNMLDTVNEIKTLYKTSLSKLESIKTKFTSDPRIIWNSHKAEQDNEGIVSLIEMSRKIQGIIYIRNYLLYAKNFLGIDELVEANFSSKKRFLKINIDTVIERYEEAYQYCKNLCYMYQDIKNFNF